MHAKSYFYRSFILCCLLLSFQEIKAQVIARDSLALVALYNAQPLMGDSTWFQGDVSTWTGVTVEGNRVTRFQVLGKSMNAPIPQEICGLDTLNVLILQNNYHTGSIPACIIDMEYLKDLSLGGNILSGMEAGTDFSHMNAIRSISIGYNYFTDMPDFVSIPSPDFQILDVMYNYFNFDDLIPVLDRIDTTNYFYYPQNTGYSTNLGFIELSPADITATDISTGVTGNLYSWHLIDGNTYQTYPITSPRFVNLDGPVLHLEEVLLSDNDNINNNTYYQCSVTNPRLPRLVWKTGYLGLFVNPKAHQIIYYMGDMIAYCGDPVFTLSAGSSTAITVVFESLNTDIATVNPDNTLNIYQRGTLTIRCTVPSSYYFFADTLLVDINIASRQALPVFQIASQLPNGEGEDLRYTVEYLPGLQYHWTLPNGDTYDSSSITISPFTPSDVGTYSIKVTEGTCVHASMAQQINSFPYGKLIIYELITPNGDSDNETFYIENLDPSVRNEVSVFNAVHQIVYHQENYRNDWDGGNLPVGSYYYLLKYGEQTYKGNLYIKR